MSSHKTYTSGMRRLGVALLLAAALPGAASADLVDWAKASVSPARMSAASSLTLQLHYDMTCGRPSGDVTVRFPARMRLLKTFGVHMGSVAVPVMVNGGTATFTVPRRAGMTCMSIGPATATFVFDGIRNPATAGSYVLHAVTANHAFTTRVVVRA
jgi:hypothetical protein